MGQEKSYKTDRRPDTAISKHRSVPIKVQVREAHVAKQARLFGISMSIASGHVYHFYKIVDGREIRVKTFGLVAAEQFVRGIGFAFSKGPYEDQKPGGWKDE